MFMVKNQSLTKRPQYERVYKSGIARGNRYLVVKSLENGLACSRFGFSIRKIIGNAVERNRIRRRLREIIRTRDIKPGWDIVIIARSKSVDADFHQLEKSMLELLNRAGLLLKKDEVVSTGVN